MKPIVTKFAALFACLLAAACSSNEPAPPPQSRTVENNFDARTTPEGISMSVYGRAYSDGSATVTASIETIDARTLSNCVVSLLDSNKRVIGQQTIGTITLGQHRSWSKSFTFYASQLTGDPAWASLSADNGSYIVSRMLLHPGPGSPGIIVP